MGYFDNEENVKKYIEMAEGYNGRELIELLKKYLPAGASVLELGSGPGTDLVILSEDFKVTGSDNSDVFVKILKSKTDVPILNLDAQSIKTEHCFDCIYSNKVLQHIDPEHLAVSIERQAEVVNQNGIIIHSFWRGSGSEEYEGLLSQYYEKADLELLFKAHYKLIEMNYYTEMDVDDSIYCIMKNIKK